MLQILAGHFHVVELEETELAELLGVRFERDNELPTVEALFKPVSPHAKLLDVFVHRGLVGDEVTLESFANVRRQDRLCKTCYVCFGRLRESDFLSVQTRRAPDVGETVVQQGNNQSVSVLVRWALEVLLDLIEHRFHGKRQ